MALSRVAPLKINGSLKNNAAILFLLDVSHFLADLLHKGALPSIVARTTTGEFKVNSATMYVCNSSVNGRRCDAIDSIEIHRETNSWLFASWEGERERKREIRDNSRNIRDLVSSGAQQTPPAMLQKPFYISCAAYSQYAIITRSSYIRASVNCATRAGTYRAGIFARHSRLSNVPSILCHFDQTRAITSPFDFKRELRATPDLASRNKRIYEIAIVRFYRDCVFFWRVDIYLL